MMNRTLEFKDTRLYQRQRTEQWPKRKATLSSVGCIHWQTSLLAHFGFDLVSFETRPENKFFVGYIRSYDLRQKATEFLSRKDLRQKIRRELSFGLFPKTLKGKFETF